MTRLCNSCFSVLFSLVVIFVLLLFATPGHAENINELWLAGNKAVNSGEYQTALRHFNAALSIAEAAGDVKSQFDLIGNIGVVHLNLGQYEKGLGLFEQALTIHRKIGDVKGEGRTLTHIGGVYQMIGQYEEALGYLEQALVIHRKIGDLGMEGAALSFIGVGYRVLGQHEEALGYHEQALAIHRKIGNVKFEGVELGLIGTIYSELGQYEKALGCSEQALAIHRKIGYVKGEGDALYLIGTIYRDLGQYEKALGYNKQALAIKRKIGDVKGEGLALNNIGVVYDDLGQDEKALGYYEQALAISLEIGDVSGEGAYLTNIGASYENLGQNEKAARFFEKGLVIFRKTDDVKSEGAVLSNIGVVYSKLGQHEKASEYYEQALAINRKTGDVFGEGTSLNNMGMTYLESGQASRAEENLLQAAKVYESIRGEIRSGQERTGFQSTLPDVYGSLATAQVVQGKKQQAFETVERGRAKSFVELLATRSMAGKAREKTAELIAMEGELKKLRQERTKLAAQPAGKKTRSALTALSGQLSTKEKERLDLIDKMRRADPELGSLMTVDPPSLGDIQARLDSHVTLVEYFHPLKRTISGKERDELWIFVVKRRGFELVPVDVTRKTLREKLREYAELLADPDSDAANVRAAAEKLYGWLVKPVADKLDTATVIVVPWKEMFHIPFASLAEAGSADQGGPYMGERWRVVVSPSAEVYRYLLKKRSEGRERVFAVGNPKTHLVPLAGAEQEAREIAGLFAGKQILIGEQATETRLRTNIGMPDVVHVAAHGIYNPSRPMLTHLALTPDAENDGKLELHEVFGLEWPGVSLVTLSACSSGKVKLGAGDDLVGLTRGFFFAGATSVLASLWDVDDEATRHFMLAFYRAYVGGKSGPESLQIAQAAMRSKPEWSHPNYWAPFVLFGDWK